MAVSLPSPEDLAAVRSLAEDLAARAGAFLLDAFQQPLDVTYKDKNERNPVTQIDAASEAMLRDGILARFPEHGVMGEETEGIAGKEDSPWLWVIDPLDGTTNFMNGLAFFAVSIGVLYQARPVAGAIFVPAAAAGAPGVVSASLGGGATLAGTPLDRSARGSLRLRLGVMGMRGARRRRRPKPTPPDLRLGDVRNLGSVALEMALVAMGTLQFAAFSSPKLWDVAAGIPIVKEAGGTVLIRDGGDWDSGDLIQSPAPPVALRDWARPVVVGDDDAARFLAERLGPQPGVVQRALHLFR